MDHGRRRGRPRGVSRGWPFALGLAVGILTAVQVEAQVFEAVGVRAQGLAGAFVAVADDASATWWNPAGLAGGAYFSLLAESGTAQEGDSATPSAASAQGAWRSTSAALAAAVPVLGISYYRLRISEIQPLPPTEIGQIGRQDQGPAAIRSSSLVLGILGVTLDQSLGDHLVVGSTLKLLRGSAAVATGPAAAASLDAAAQLNGSTSTRVDFDLGLMATVGPARLAVVAKNVTNPAFGDAGQIQVSRQVRIGAALSPAALTGRRLDSVTLALDADLTTTPTAAGGERRLAAGAEAWLGGHRLAVRSGVSASTAGATRVVGAAGLSYGIRSHWYLEGQATVGADQARRGWGLGSKLTF